MNVWVAIYRFAWGLLGVLLVLSLGALFYPPIRKAQELERRKAGLEEEARFIQGKVTNLREKQEMLMNDRAYVERVARDDLGYAMPNEVIFKTEPPGPARQTK